MMLKNTLADPISLLLLFLICCCFVMQILQWLCQESMPPLGAHGAKMNFLKTP